MKKLFFFLLSVTAVISACNQVGRHENNNDHDSDEVQEHAMPSGQKAIFAQITDLPAGIETIFGKEPSKENGSYKFSFPRTDLKVTDGGIIIDSRLAFTTWFAFMPGQNSHNAMLMGDMVLLETELPAVEKKLAEEGIDITAIHNHLIGESPKIMYLHVSAMGDPVDLCNKLKVALMLTKTPLKAIFNDTAVDVDWGQTEAILGLKGKRNGPVLSFGIPREERITENGMELPPGFGISTGIAFQKVGKEAAITGDFVLMAGEVNPVVKALTQNGITVTAIHNHMLEDNPHLFMMHFWGVGNPETLAKGLKAAIDKTNSQI